MTNIDITNLTNSTQVVKGISDGTGVFDQLMNTVNMYLEDQYQNNRLKGTDYANVMLGSIQAVLQSSLQFTLQEQLTEAQIENALKDIELKNAELALKQEQRKETYTARVVKDKEAANLGLDQVVKNANASPETVYKPKYEDV